MKRLLLFFLSIFLFLPACGRSSNIADAPPVREMPVSLAPVAWDGIDPARDVYVSRNGIVHDSPRCSGMRHYTTMTAAEAYADDLPLCHVCW